MTAPTRFLLSRRSRGRLATLLVAVAIATLFGVALRPFPRADASIALGAAPAATVAAVIAGWDHTCARKSDGTFVCWGEITAPTDRLRTVRAGSAGGFHTCAIEMDGTLACWGYNFFGQATVPDGLGTVTAVSAGYLHTCAIKSDGTLACWGLNGTGQINVPGGLGTVSAASAGGVHTCATKPDGTVTCWGLWNDAILPGGLGSVSAGGDHTCAIQSSGTVDCWGYDGTGQTDVPAGLGAVSAVSAGGYHTCALKSDGNVACWGLNRYGQSTVPDGLGAVRAISAGGTHTCAIKIDGGVACWGDNSADQGIPPVDLVTGAAVTDHVAIEFVSELGGAPVRWEGGVASGAVMTMLDDGRMEWLQADARYGGPAVTLTAKLHSRHMARLMAGWLTATRGTARIQFRDVIAPFARADDGTVTNPIPIRATYYDGVHLVFGYVKLRFGSE